MSPRDIEFRQLCERRKPRVVWNTETRCFLSKSDNESLISDLFHCPVWPVEFTRVAAPPTSKGRSKDTDVRLSLHGVSYMDLSSLLYPGTTRVFGAYPVIAFSESDLSDRTDHRNICSVLEIVYPKPQGTSEIK